MEPTKPTYLSKTLFLNLLSAAFAYLYPPANDWVNAHPDMVVGFFTMLNIVLRFFTKDKLTIW